MPMVFSQFYQIYTIMKDENIKGNWKWVRDTWIFKRYNLSVNQKCFHIFYFKKSDGEV